MGGDEIQRQQVTSPYGNQPRWWQTMEQDPWYKTAGKAILGEREFHELGEGDPKAWINTLAPLLFTGRGKLAAPEFSYPSAGGQISTGGQIRLNAAFRNLDKAISEKAPELGISKEAMGRILTGEKPSDVIPETRQRDLLEFLNDPSKRPEDILPPQASVNEALMRLMRGYV